MIRIITDSSSDLDLEQAAQLNVDVIPIHIRFGETEYQDRQNLSVTDFYNKLKTVTELPTTCLLYTSRSRGTRRNARKT